MSQYLQRDRTAGHRTLYPSAVNGTHKQAIFPVVIVTRPVMDRCFIVNTTSAFSLAIAGYNPGKRIFRTFNNWMTGVVMAVQ